MAKSSGRSSARGQSSGPQPGREADRTDQQEKLFSIGEAARVLRVRTSTLRYYDERGLVKPRTRRAGKRWYGRAELRKIAFLQMLQRLNVDLDVGSDVFDPPSAGWRVSVREQILGLERLLLEASVARAFLSHLLECPSEYPTRDCEVMHRHLDEHLAGKPLEEVAREHGLKLPSLAARRRHPRAARRR